MTRLRHLIILLIIPFFSLFLLYWRSSKSKGESVSFKRDLTKQRPVEVTSFDLGFAGYYVAGMNDSTVHLGNVQAPTHIVTFHLQTRDTTLLRLKLPREYESVWHPFKMRMEGSTFQLADRGLPAVMAWRVGESNARVKICELQGRMVSAGIPTSDTTAVFRIYDASCKQNTLVRSSVSGKSEQTSSPYVLEGEQDNVFASDGQLLLDRKRNRILYVYYYTNKITCLDSALSLVGHFYTLDTTSVVNIPKRFVRSEGMETMAAPSPRVNSKVHADSNYLFVVPSANAVREHRRGQLVVDVYSLEHQQYEYSFHLPLSKTRLLEDFKVYNNAVVVVYDRRLMVYRFPPSEGEDF